MLVAVGARAVGDEEAGIQTQSTQSIAHFGAINEIERNI